jgi:hypothetical protein
MDRRSPMLARSQSGADTGIHAPAQQNDSARNGVIVRTGHLHFMSTEAGASIQFYAPSKRIGVSH